VDAVEYPAAEEASDGDRDIEENLRIHASLVKDIDCASVEGVCAV
jgi:hypothetical protein